MIEDYVGKGEDAPEFLPYGLTFQHKHVPELRKYARLARDPLMQPAVGNFAQGMITVVPLQLGELERVPTGAELHAAIADHYAGIEGGVGRRGALRARWSAAPSIDPEIYNDTNRMRLHVFANDEQGAGAAGRRLRQSRQGRVGRGRAEHGPDARAQGLISDAMSSRNFRSAGRSAITN